MAKLNLHLDSKNEYIDLAKDLLSPIGLEFQSPRVKGEGPSLRSISSNPDGGFVNTHEACVEVISELSLDSKKANIILNKIQSYQKAYPSNIVYVILFHPVVAKVMKILDEGLISITKGEFSIFDSNWVQKTLNENPELIEKYKIKEGGESKPMTFDPDKLVKYTSFIEAAQNRQIFLSHHIWSDEDKLKHFLTAGIWKPQNERKNKDILDKITRGDLIILNSSTLNGEGIVMKVVAIGVVKTFAFDNSAIDVIWKELNATISLPDSDAFSNALSLLTENQIETTLGRLMGATGDILGILDELIEIVPLAPQSKSTSPDKSIESITALIQSHLTQKKNFWWLHARVDKWEIDELAIGQSEPYRATDTADKIQRNFHDIEVGDLVFGYQGAPEKKVKGIFQVDHKDLDSHVSFKLLYKIEKQPSLDDLRKRSNFEKSTINKVRVGSIHALTTAIVQEILDSTELTNPSSSKTEKDPVKPTIEPTKDKIPFHNDVVAQEDKLGREPVAKAFVDLIKKDVFTEDMNHAFMVHLQGEWGAGKSTFLNLIKKHLNTEEEEWIIIDYNAWQNQHITPPWWTLIDQIYRQTRVKDSFGFCGKLDRKEKWRRIKLYSGWQKIVAITLTILITACLVHFGNSIADYVKELPFFRGDQDAEDTGSAIAAISKLFLTLGSIVAVIFTFSKVVSSSFFMNSSDEANSFMKRSSDPMSRIKTHFGGLVNDINSKEKTRWWSKSNKKKRQLAIFIDDIDRCNRGFIIQLLEGIQTLFKDKKVLYIVAGDKNWITTSFANTYKEFNNSQSTSKHNLGELFLEKAFQMSLRMPNISDDSKEEYWSHILGITEAQREKKVETEEISSELKNEVQQELDSTEEDITSPEFIEKFERKHNFSSNAASNFIIEKKNESDKEIRHLLKGLHGLVETNPRSIIRLANNYTMTRSTLIAERKSFNAEKLLRWLILKDLYPTVIDSVRSNKTMKEIKEELTEPSVREKYDKLLTGSKEDETDILSIEEIKQFEGI